MEPRLWKIRLALLLFLFVGGQGTAAIPEKMVLVAGGVFQMGVSVSKSSSQNKAIYPGLQDQKSASESPAHSVELMSFYLDQYEVSNADFRRFLEQHPEWKMERARGHRGQADPNYLIHWQGGNVRTPSADTYPVVYVSWFAAQAYCQAQGKRLPTEAEWERAARAGTTTLYAYGNSVETLLPHAWFYFNSARQTHPVDSKRPNRWGIYHLNGNVWEWVSDWYASDYYQNSPRRNPLGPKAGRHKVIRGGGWYDGPQRLRSTSRDYVRPEYAVEDIGFRCAMSADVKK